MPSMLKCNSGERGRYKTNICSMIKMYALHFIFHLMFVLDVKLGTIAYMLSLFRKIKKHMTLVNLMFGTYIN